MAITSTFTVPSRANLPSIRVAPMTGTLVLFYKPEHGVVLEAGNTQCDPVGGPWHAESWESYREFHGTITLTQHG